MAPNEWPFPPQGATLCARHKRLRSATSDVGEMSVPHGTQLAVFHPASRRSYPLIPYGAKAFQTSPADHLRRTRSAMYSQNRTPPPSPDSVVLRPHRHTEADFLGCPLMWAESVPDSTVSAAGGLLATDDIHHLSREIAPHGQESTFPISTPTRTVETLALKASWSVFKGRSLGGVQWCYSE